MDIPRSFMMTTAQGFPIGLTTGVALRLRSAVSKKKQGGAEMTAFIVGPQTLHLIANPAI